MRQLVIDRRICCCSQFMIFLFELLGPAKQPMACPSSSNRKIMNWEQQQILLSTTNCLILPVFLIRHVGQKNFLKNTRVCTLVIHQFEIFDWPIKLNSIFKCWPKDQTFFQLYFFPSGKSQSLICVYIACLSVFSALKLQFLGKNDHFLTCYVFVFEIQ